MKKFLALFLVGALVFPAAASAQFGFKVPNPIKEVETSVKKAVPVSLEAPDMQVRNSMIVHLEQLNTHCPLSARPSDLDRCKSVTANIKGLLDRVELQNRIIPEYKQVVELVAKVEGNVPEWENQIKAEAEADKLARQERADFEEKVSKHGIIGRIKEIDKNPTERLAMDEESLLRDVASAKAMETEFLEPCKAGRYANTRTSVNEDNWQHPKNICDMAQNWRAPYKAYVERVLENKRTRTADNITSTLKDLEESGKLYENDIALLSKPADTIAKFVKDYAKISAEFEIPMNAKYFDNVVQAAKPYAATLKKAGSVQRWDDKASFSDKEVNAAFTKALTDEKLSVKKIGLVQSDYSINKNDFGLPLNKYRSGNVMVKANGESFCRIYSLTARAEYEGGVNGYTKPYANFDRKDTGFIVSKCK